MIRPSKMKRSVPWIVAAAFLMAVGGIVFSLRNQELPDTFSHVPQTVVETQGETAPQPTQIPELEGVRMAADPETVGPILASADEPEEEEIVEEQPPVDEEEEAEPQYTSYTVQSGDTLGDIALRHNVRVIDIMETNDNIAHPNRVYAGHDLSVPEPWDIPVVGLFSGILDVPRPYTVQTGETLSEIAAHRGLTLEAVLEANPDISDPNRVVSGDTVNIPPHPANRMPDFNQDNVQGAYTVEDGDTLSDIAINHDTSIDQVLEINQQIEDPNLIFTGQVIAVPEPGEVIPVTGLEESGYVVQPGDTLSEIAFRHGLTVDEMAAANDIENPNLILVGQLLVIPERSQAEVETDVANAEGRRYIVREGDNLGEIALRHRKTVAELVEANQIENPNRIVPGQVVIIPEA